MKAFLSHSSLDKDHVEKVVVQLGTSQVEVDTDTFTKALFNVQAINEALDRSDLFVLFLSKNSVKSNFVSYETTSALEMIASGKLSKILVLCLDDEVFNLVEGHLKKFVFVRKVPDPGYSFRKIQSMLTQMRIDSGVEETPFIGRHDEIRDIRAALLAPYDISPNAIAVTGFPGVGRQSTVRQAIKEIYAESQLFHPKISIDRNFSVVDIYMKLLREISFLSLRESLNLLDAFRKKSSDEQIQTIANHIREISENGEFIHLTDGGGLIQESGRYHPTIEKALQELNNLNRVGLILIQSRVNPKYLRDEEYSQVKYIRVNSLNQTDTSDLVSALLSRKKIRYNSKQLEKIVSLVDGNPINAKYVVDYISQNGIGVTVTNPDELIVWKVRQAKNYIDQIQFSKTEKLIVGLLLDYRYLTVDLMVGATNKKPSDIVVAITKLLNDHCINFDNEQYFVNPPLRDAFEREPSFRLRGKQINNIALRMVGLIEKAYVDEDVVDLAIIGPAMVASLRAQKNFSNSEIQRFVQPSHLLSLAKDEYDLGDYTKCLDYSARVWQFESYLTEDAKVEAVRLACMSAARLGKTSVFNRYFRRLNDVKTRHSDYTKSFCRGFLSRRTGELIKAEKEFLRCVDLKSRAFASCRELAGVLLSLNRPTEAETYARIAFEIAPTNPYVVEILLNILIENTTTNDELRNTVEIKRLFSILEDVGDGPKQAFLSLKRAQYFGKLGKIEEAIDWANIACKRKPGLFAAHRLRASLKLKDNDINGAEKDFKKLQSILYDEKSGEGQTYITEYFISSIEIMVAKRQYRAAYNQIAKIRNKVPFKIEETLSKKLTSAIQWDQDFHDAEVIEWAKNFT